MDHERTIERIEIIEWYDGLVLGLATFPGAEALVCLLAFDPDARRKLYLFISIPPKECNALRKLFKDRGPQGFTKKIIAATLQGHCGVYLTIAEPKTGGSVVLHPLTATQIGQILLPGFPTIEFAVARSKMWDWFDEIS